MCGIFGFINRSPQRINKSALRILGVANDSRGGDSCGLFIDDKVEIGFDKEKLFYNFIFKSELLASKARAKIILGHCRKASVGTISKDTAQPVVIRDELGNIKFVLIHNGTIFNYKDLAEKYIPDVKIDNMTDSQVMANLLYREKYDVFSEYNGGSVFVFTRYDDPNNPRTFVFQGESKSVEFSKNTSIERPFYWLTDCNDTVVFSSIDTILEAMYGVPSYGITTNMLCEIKNGEIFNIKEYSRDKCIQTRIYKASDYPTYYGGYNNNYGYNNYYNQGYGARESGNTLYPSATKNFVEFESGLFYRGGDELDGVYRITKFGKFSDENDKDTMEYFFFAGTLLYNEECYMYLEGACGMLGCSHSDLFEMSPEIVNYYSPYPLQNYFLFGDKLYYKSQTPTKMSPFNGELTPLFTYKRFNIKNGVVKNQESITGMYTAAYNEFNICKNKTLEFPSYDEF